jgi:hypothetical protein
MLNAGWSPLAPGRCSRGAPSARYYVFRSNRGLLLRLTRALEGKKWRWHTYFDDKLFSELKP